MISILLTARDEEYDRLLDFELGHDDNVNNQELVV